MKLGKSKNILDQILTQHLDLKNPSNLGPDIDSLSLSRSISIVDKMSEKCQKWLKLSKNCPEGLKTQFSDIFWRILPIRSMLLFGDLVHCSPVASVESLFGPSLGPSWVCTWATRCPPPPQPQQQKSKLL